MQNEEKELLLEYLIQFLNIEKRYPLLPGTEDKSNVAEFIGLDEKELTQTREKFEDNARKASQELLKNEEQQKKIDQLPFKKDDTIAVIGDSITDDLQSWFAIFRHVMETTVKAANFTWIDGSLGGDTSANALMRMDRDVLVHEPDWVILALGSDDAVRPHVASNRTLVSLAEFWENVSTMESAISQVTGNPVIWMTPPPVISEMMEQNALFNGILQEEDLADYREVIAGKTGYIIDPSGNRMGNPPEAWNYLGDGFHPSLSGHLNTVNALIDAMTEYGKSDQGDEDDEAAREEDDE